MTISALHRTNPNTAPLAIVVVFDTLLSSIVADGFDAVLGIPAERETPAGRKIPIRIELLGDSRIGYPPVERIVASVARRRCGCGEVARRVVSVALRVVGGVLGIGDALEGVMNFDGRWS